MPDEPIKPPTKAADPVQKEEAAPSVSPPTAPKIESTAEVTDGSPLNQPLEQSRPENPPGQPNTSLPSVMVRLGASDEGANRNFPDPTVPTKLTDGNDDQSFAQLSEAARKKVGMLRDGCSIFVSSLNKTVLDRATRYLATHAARGITNEKELTTRALTLNGPYVIERIRLSDFLNTKRVLCFGETGNSRWDGSHQVVVVDVTNPAAFEQLRECGDSLRTPIWKSYNIYFVFSIHPEVCASVSLDVLETAGFKETRISHWQVPALEYLLFPDHRAEHGEIGLVHQLSAQWKAGKWDAETEIDFLRKVDEYLAKHHLEGLRQEILRRENIAAPARITPIEIRERWKRSDVAVRAAMFTGTYFDKAPVGDFHRIMGTLLKGEEIVTGKTHDKFLPELGKTVQEPDPAVAANVYWENGVEDILEKAGFKYVKGPETGRVITFSRASDKEPTWEGLPASEVKKFFDRLHQHALLFNPRSTDFIIEALIKLTVQMVDEYGTYDEDWLLDCVRWIHGQLDSFAEEAGRNLAENNQSVTEFDKILEAMSDVLASLGEGHKFFHQRLAQLCKALLADQKGRERTEKFLTNFIKLAKGGSAPVELIRLLPDTPNFSQLKYLGQILASGKKETCMQVIKVLLEEARRSPDRAEAVLAAVKGWLPETKLPNGRSLPTRESWALAFPYFLFYMYREEHKNKRDNQKTCPSPFDSPENFDDAKQSFFANWLNHPLLPTALAERAHDFEISPSWLYFQAEDNSSHSKVLDFVEGPDEVTYGEGRLGEILEGWYRIADEEGVGRIAEKIGAGLEAKPLVHIVRFLRWRAQCIEFERNESSNKQRRTRLYEERKRLMRLIPKLKK
jgi:hypothetical protein